ncbi:MAG: helix-hairpin-helix domain-containing protein [Thiolinea sp.]
MAADQDSLQAVPDVGPVVAERVWQFFQEAHNQRTLTALQELRCTGRIMSHKPVRICR